MSLIDIHQKEQQKTVRLGFLTVTLFILIYVTVMSYFSILRYSSFHANAFDMGLMIQTVWNTSQGRLLEESINIGKPTSRILVAHWEFIYIPVALLYKIFQSPYMLLIIQTFVLALGAYAVYWLAKDKLKSLFVAISFAVVYLLYPAMQNVNLCDIHGLAFSTSLILFAFYFLQKSDFKKFGVFAFLALMCREDVSLILFMFGLYAYFILKEKKVGLIVSIVGIVWFILFFKRATIQSMLGLPLINFHSDIPSHWAHLKAAVDDPSYMVEFLAKKHNIWYVINLFGPVGFLSFFSPFTVILMAPTFLINILSDWYFAHGIEHVYTSTITPIVFISAIYGLENALKLIKKLRLSTPQKRKYYENKFLVSVSIVMVVLAFLFSITRSNVFEAAKYKVTEHHKTVDKIIALIPANASLSADVYLSSHAAERREIYVFPDKSDSVDYVLYDFHSPQFHMYTREDFYLEHCLPINQYIEKMLFNKLYGIIYYQDGVLLLQKDADYDRGIKLIASASEQEIPYPVAINISDELIFKGYQSPEIVNIWFPDETSKDFIRWEKVIRVALYWEKNTDLSTEKDFNYIVSNGINQFSFKNKPVWGTYPITKWEQNKIVQDKLFFIVPTKIPSGDYSLYVAVTDQDQIVDNLGRKVKLLTFRIN